LLIFTKEIEKCSNGELKIHVVGGPEIINEFSKHEAVADGRFDFALGLLRYVSGVVKGGDTMLLTSPTP
jgi:hypothetical protein